MITVLTIAAFAVLEALQVLIITAHIYSFIPIRWKAAIPPGLEPERESFLYGVFLLSTGLFAMAAMKWIFPRIQSPQALKQFLQFLAAEAVWIFLLLFAAFKWITYRYPFYNVLPYENGRWVGLFFYGVLVLSLLSKIFWPEILRLMRKFDVRWQAFTPSAAQRAMAYGAFAVLVWLLLLPDTTDAVALSYVWDQFNHWDAWGPSRWFLQHGGNYHQLVLILVLSTVVFWTAVFILVERWLKSFGLAALAVFLGIKMNLFHYGMAPLPWLFPKAVFSWPLDFSSWQGLDNVAMYDALRVRLFFSFFMGFALPVFYVFNLLLRLPLVARLIAAYGALICVQYIARPALFSYGTVSLPAVLLLCFWIEQGGRRFLPRYKRVVFAALAIAAFGALLTNRVFVAYPHSLNIYGQDFSKERDAFSQAMDLSADAALVDRLSKPGDAVAVVGSFETALLKQAGRTAFFKHSPLVVSAPMSSGMVKGLRIKTKQELLNTLKELEANPPAHIFMEKKFSQLPQDFYQGPSGLAILLLWVANHYKPAAQGQYYTAWQKS